MKHDETLGQPLPRGTTGASATNRVDHGGCPSDLQPLIQRMYDEAAQCDVFGITKPAALLREAADALQHAANLQAMDEFAEVVTAGHLGEADHSMRDLLLLARSEIYHEPECMPGEPCNCGKGELMRRMDAVLKA